MELKIEKRGDKEGLVIWLPLEVRPFPLSDSSKSFTVATTRGIKMTELIVEGEALNVGINCYIANRGYVKPEKAVRK